jgi:hypothetical protein
MWPLISLRSNALSFIKVALQSLEGFGEGGLRHSC